MSALHAFKPSQAECPPFIVPDELPLRLAEATDVPAASGARALQNQLLQAVNKRALRKASYWERPSRRGGLLIALGGSALGWWAVISGVSAMARHFTA